MQALINNAYAKHIERLHDRCDKTPPGQLKIVATSPFLKANNSNGQPINYTLKEDLTHSSRVKSTEPFPPYAKTQFAPPNTLPSLDIEFYEQRQELKRLELTHSTHHCQSLWNNVRGPRPNWYSKRTNDFWIEHRKNRYHSSKIVQQLEQEFQDKLLQLKRIASERHSYNPYRWPSNASSQHFD